MKNEHTRKLAQQGYAQAIADLINHSLSAQSIQVSAKNNNGCLEIKARGSKVADQSLFLETIKTGISRLKPENVSLVIVTFIEEGCTSYAWRSGFRIDSSGEILETSLPSPSNSTSLKSKHFSASTSKSSSDSKSDKLIDIEKRTENLEKFVEVCKATGLLYFTIIKNRLLPLSKVQKIAILCSILGVSIAGVTYRELTRERVCKFNGTPVLELGQQYHRRWKEADELASQTARMDLASQVNRLQDIKNEIEYSGWPECARPIQTSLGQLLFSRISHFTDFMAGEDLDNMGTRVSIWMKVSNQIDYAESLMRVATTQEQEKLKSYQEYGVSTYLSELAISQFKPAIYDKVEDTMKYIVDREAYQVPDELLFTNVEVDRDRSFYNFARNVYYDPSYYPWAYEFVYREDHDVDQVYILEAVPQEGEYRHFMLAILTDDSLETPMDFVVCRADERGEPIEIPKLSSDNNLFCGKGSVEI